jgi:putative membrane protein
MFSRRIAATLGMTGLLLLPAAGAQAARPSDQDVAFLRAAHQVNLAEIAAGRIAFQKTTDPEVKKLAGKFMHDHIFMDADLTGIARELHVMLPDTPTAEQQALAKRYQAAGADTFDEYYISTQLAAHREAHQLAAAQAENGAIESVKGLAAKALPIIAHHQEELRAEAEAEGYAGYIAVGGR